MKPVFRLMSAVLAFGAAGAATVGTAAAETAPQPYQWGSYKHLVSVSGAVFSVIYHCGDEAKVRALLAPLGIKPTWKDACRYGTGSVAFELSKRAAVTQALAAVAGIDIQDGYQEGRTTFTSTGQIILAFKPEASADQIADTLLQFGLSVGDTSYCRTIVYKKDLTQGTSELALADQLSRLPIVDHAEPNIMGHFIDPTSEGGVSGSNGKGH